MGVIGSDHHPITSPGSPSSNLFPRFFDFTTWPFRWWFFPKPIGSFPPRGPSGWNQPALATSCDPARTAHFERPVFFPQMKHSPFHLLLVSHLNMDGWNTSFLLGRPIFRGYVSFRDCIFFCLFSPFLVEEKPNNGKTSSPGLFWRTSPSLDSGNCMSRQVFQKSLQVIKIEWRGALPSFPWP